ncbi:MAG: hypothetical protein AAFU79_23000 [Myxococcota bacterium]
MNRWGWCVVIALSSSACGDLDPPVPSARVSTSVVFTGSSTVSLEGLRVVAGLNLRSASAEVWLDRSVTSTAAGLAIDLVAAEPETAGGTQQFFFVNRLSSVLSVRGLGVEFLAYLDGDASRTYRPDVDVIVGTVIDGRGYAFLPELEDQLLMIPPEFAADFRAAVPPGQRSLLPIQEQLLTPDDHPITLDLASPSQMALRLCGVDITRLPIVEPMTSVWLDAGLDAVALCGLAVADCVSVDLEAVAQPLLPEEDAFASAQCRPRGGLEVLVLESRVPACSPACECGVASKVEAYVTTATAAPSWWPCGAEVERCEAGGSLLRIAPECR